MAAFKVDENLPPEAAEALRAAGHDAVTVADEGMSGAGDAVVAEGCRTEGRALVTLDTDFSDISLYPPGEYAGLVVLRLSRQSKPHVLAVLSRLIPELGRERLSGALWIVDEARIRMREGTR